VIFRRVDKPNSLVRARYLHCSHPILRGRLLGRPMRDRLVCCRHSDMANQNHLAIGAGTPHLMETRVLAFSGSLICSSSPTKAQNAAEGERPFEGTSARPCLVNVCHRIHPQPRLLLKRSDLRRPLSLSLIPYIKHDWKTCMPPNSRFCRAVYFSDWYSISAP
jgi:hypothetical protein